MVLASCSASELLDSKSFDDGLSDCDMFIIFLGRSEIFSFLDKLRFGLSTGLKTTSRSLLFAIVAGLAGAFVNLLALLSESAT